MGRSSSLGRLVRSGTLNPPRAVHILDRELSPAEAPTSNHLMQGIMAAFGRADSQGRLPTDFVPRLPPALHRVVTTPRAGST